MGTIKIQDKRFKDSDYRMLVSRLTSAITSQGIPVTFSHDKRDELINITGEIYQETFKRIQAVLEKDPAVNDDKVLYDIQLAKESA